MDMLVTWTRFDNLARLVLSISFLLGARERNGISLRFSK